MIISIVILVLALTLSPIGSNYLGYDELTLIEEKKPFKVQCMAHIPEHLRTVEVKWFNVTSMSTDRSDEKMSHVLLDVNNELVSFAPNGVLYSQSARTEHNGYYSCRVHYTGGRRHHTKYGHKHTDYRLHLIEVTKRPSISKLEDFLSIELLTDSENPDNEMISVLLKDLVLNKDFKTNINSVTEQVLCDYQSDDNSMKCHLKIRSDSKVKCLTEHCSPELQIFQQNLEEDVHKIQNLIKSNEELFKSKIQLIDIKVKRFDVNSGLYCPEGYYFSSNLCRPCPSGQYRAKDDPQCHDCPINTFNPFFGQSSCRTCPGSSKTTRQGFEGFGEGSTNIHECKYVYSQGFFGFIKDLFI